MKAWRIYSFNFKKDKTNSKEDLRVKILKFKIYDRSFQSRDAYGSLFPICAHLFTKIN